MYTSHPSQTEDYYWIPFKHIAVMQDLLPRINNYFVTLISSVFAMYTLKQPNIYVWLLN